MSAIKIIEKSYNIAMAMLFIGIILAIIEKPLAIYFYAAGIIPILGIRIFNFVVGKPENKRKHLIMVISALFLVIAGIAIFMNRSWWIIFIAISAILDFYISFRRFR